LSVRVSLAKRNDRGEETAMRSLILAGCALVAALASTPQVTAADPIHPWCFVRDAGMSGLCAFDSRSQCMMTKGNSEGYCTENVAAPRNAKPEPSDPDPHVASAIHSWCLRGNTSGAISCSFDSRSQCMMSKGNSEGYCDENAAAPNVAAVAAEPDPHVTSPARAWCLMGNSSGGFSCAFDSLAQCLATRGGSEGYCYENAAAPKRSSTAR